MIGKVRNRSDFGMLAGTSGMIAKMRNEQKRTERKETSNRDDRASQVARVPAHLFTTSKSRVVL
jgi:hypothetical protein